MRSELKRLQRELGRTLVYVTHDQVEAMSMADRIAVLREGVVQQIDVPETIYHRPANRFVATVVGSPPMNFLAATARWNGDDLRVEHPLFAVAARPPEAAAARAALPDGSPCWVGIRPEDVHIAAGGGGLPATVYVTEPLGGETVVDLQFGDLLLKSLAPPTLSFQADQQVSIELDATRLHVFTEAGDAVLSAGGESVFTLSAATPA